MESTRGLILRQRVIVKALSQNKPPPTINVNRDWTIPDTAAIGTVITNVELISEDNSEFEFGLEQGNGPFRNTNPSEPLPFTINEKTGEVVTNQSLINMGGREFFVAITARSADRIPAKIEIWAKIVKSTGKKGSTRLTSYPRNPGMPNLPDATKLSVQPNSNSNIVYTSDNTTLRVSDGEIAQTYGDKTGLQSPTLDNTSQESATTTTTTPPNSIADPSPKPEQSSKINILLIPTIVIATSLFISGIIAYLFRKKLCRKRHKISKDDMKKSSSSMSLEESMVLQHWRGIRAMSNRFDSWDSDSNHNQCTVALNTKSIDKWEIPRHHIKVFSILGEGCFGQVWKCEALGIDNKEGPTVVAVKMLKENAGEQERNDLMQELQVMKMLDPHPNVVRLLGCCTDRDPIFVILEYVPHGKLQSFLRHSRAQRYYNNMHGSSNTLTSQDLTSFCYQIAKGMQYLSGKGIIHRDLAARNILVSENHTCKVADFGFARDIMTSHIYERKSEGRLPIRWMAPESLYDNIFSVKSDIWSYGVLIWEIVTLGSTPYPGIPAAEVMKRVRDGHRLDKPEHCRRELYNIMYYCWDKDPKERPTFDELVDLLEQLLLTETDYIQLDRFPDHSYYNMVSLSGEKL
ncbi:hypothetical protein V9T40_001749 [Parthenolecanium corni]|uniref:receptor protein-tyrosine kinase n=1 Tax=Parthenolecanium corni TaxID=536013 RepID=A0AAN9TW54_9HEMI